MTVGTEGTEERRDSRYRSIEEEWVQWDSGTECTEEQ